MKGSTSTDRARPRKLIVRIWHTSEGNFVPLPEECRQLEELEMWIFTDFLLLFPKDKHRKPSPEFKTHLLTAVGMLELREQMGKAFKEAEKATKRLKRRVKRKRK